MAAPDVWVAKDDGSDIIRASAIAGVGRDYNGNVTIRLAGGNQAVVTIVADNEHDGPHTPTDFHLQLLQVITELSDTAEPAMVRPVHHEPGGWTWQTGPLQERKPGRGARR
jgi:hypothetical protein